jgi:hypothetical protein
LAAASVCAEPFQPDSTFDRAGSVSLKTAYPADFWINSLDVGWVYTDPQGCAAILRVFSRFWSGVSFAAAKPPASKITARLEAIILNLIGVALSFIIIVELFVAESACHVRLSALLLSGTRHETF